ncbi:class I SAM-dependent methyltransferase [Pedobacter polaris]|uniref:Class I SAM-dependent methyltransferase n=1 Tax=Pedobacter polaris TaxID=2571273 RepID=A0A4U1CCM9_9SPHI|nr:class I SAM-dependent methyltransferase [Pedobacter polaris]TKC04582.1 class I SAM-dependent methyltransferase [Pedobacter polaris]
MSNQAASFYNRFSFFYPIIEVFLKPQKVKLMEEINTLASGKLLEVGVGSGTHLPLYQTHQITGIDISSAMLNEAEKHKQSDTILLKMSGEDLQFEDDYFDYVVLSHVLAVASNPEKLLEEVYRVLKPNGKVLILNHFTTNNWLRYIDTAFNSISGLFHFNSLFKIESFNAIKKFTLIKEVGFGRFSYFKLLIFNK